MEGSTVVLYHKTSNLDFGDWKLPERPNHWEYSPDQRGFASAFEACFVPRWSFSHLWSGNQSQSDLPVPERWEWASHCISRRWQPFWASMNIGSKACSELVKCGLYVTRLSGSIVSLFCFVLFCYALLCFRNKVYVSHSTKVKPVICHKTWTTHWPTLS